MVCVLVLVLLPVVVMTRTLMGTCTASVGDAWPIMSSISFPSFLFFFSFFSVALAVGRGGSAGPGFDELDDRWVASFRARVGGAQGIVRWWVRACGWVMVFLYRMHGLCSFRYEQITWFD
jgi:hypothetical protein